MGPFRCVNMVVSVIIDDITYTVGVVEGKDIQIGYTGEPNPHYGSRVKKHSAGSKLATFTLTRWYYADTGQESLFLDLITNETIFSLQGSLVDKDGVAIPDTTLKITGCRLYKYKPKTGGADNVIGETAVGIGAGWDISGFLPTGKILTVISAHGTPDPSVGDHLYDDFSSVTCSVISPVIEDEVTYICTGWTGTGSVPASGSGTIITFIIDENSSITWNWVIQRTLTVSSAHDSPSPSVGIHIYNDGSFIICSVSSPVIEDDISYTCTGWTGTGSVPASGSDTIITFTITEDSTIIWNWILTPIASVEFKCNNDNPCSNPSSITYDGVKNTTPYTVDDVKQYTIHSIFAETLESWKHFTYWEVVSGDIAIDNIYANPTTFIITSDSGIILAHFEDNPPPPPPPPPTPYVSVGLLDFDFAKPYYYDGWYYVLFYTDVYPNDQYYTINYAKSSDLETWIVYTIGTFRYRNYYSPHPRWGSMFVDDFVCIVFNDYHEGVDEEGYPNYPTIESITGTIQPDGSILFGSPIIIAEIDQASAISGVKAVKIGSNIKLFTIVCGDKDWHYPFGDGDNLYISDDEGATWVYKDKTTANFGMAWRRFNYKMIPLLDDNKFIELVAPPQWEDNYWTRTIWGIYRNPTSYDNPIEFGDYIYGEMITYPYPPWRDVISAVDCGAEGCKLGSYIYVAYIDLSKNVKLRRASVSSPSTWENLGTVDTFSGGEYNLCASCVADSTNNAVYVVYSDSHNIYYSRWTSIGGLEEPVTFYTIENPTVNNQMNYLTVHPDCIDNKIIMVWMQYEYLNVGYGLYQWKVYSFPIDLDEE